jgi:hypothetical protein
MKGLLSYTGLDDVLEEMSDEHREMAIVESAVGYGAYETMQEFTGNRADVVRAAARRYGDNITR